MTKAEINNEAEADARKHIPSGFEEVSTGRIVAGDKVWNRVMRNWDVVKMNGNLLPEQTYMTIRKKKQPIKVFYETVKRNRQSIAKMKYESAYFCLSLNEEVLEMLDERKTSATNGDVLGEMTLKDKGSWGTDDEENLYAEVVRSAIYG